MTYALTVNVHEPSDHLICVTLEVERSQGSLFFHDFKEIEFERLHHNVQVLVFAFLAGVSGVYFNDEGAFKHFYHL